MPNGQIPTTWLYMALKVRVLKLGSRKMVPWTEFGKAGEEEGSVNDISQTVSRPQLKCPIFNILWYLLHPLT